MKRKKIITKDKAMKLVEGTASKTVKATLTMVKAIFFLIIIYTVIVSIYLFFTSNQEQFLTNIAMISVGGFWAFFLGYFGWRMGETLENYFFSIKRRK